MTNTEGQRAVRWVSLKPLSDGRRECRVQSVNAIRYQVIDIRNAFLEVAKNSITQKWKAKISPLLTTKSKILNFVVKIVINFSTLILQLTTLNDTHTHTHTPHVRTPVEEGWASRRDLYPKTHNNHNRQPSMSPAGCKPATPGIDGPQIHALDRAATGNGRKRSYLSANFTATEIASEMEVERKFRQRLLKRKRYEDGINNSPENIFETEYFLGIVDLALIAPPARQKQFQYSL